MFGLHKIPVGVSQEGLSISLDEHDEYSLYRRESPDGMVEKVLLGVPSGIMLVPVEPLNQPRRITPYLLIELTTPAIIPPGGETSIYLKFPTEIGVFLPRGQEYDLLETISLSPKKFSLYGTPRGGHVTRIWKSEVYSSLPEADPLHEGVVKLEISNEASEWLQVKQTVFDVHGMKIFYKQDLVAARARMTVLSDSKAETEFVDSPLEGDMKSSIELFKPGMLSVTSIRYYMSEGL